MNVSEAVAQRRSVRAFLDTPVDGKLVRDILGRSTRAPSGGNVQPWHLHILGGQPMAEFKALMRQRLAEAPAGEQTDYDIYPPGLVEPYRSRRRMLGVQLYERLGIGHHDEEGRRAQLIRNFQFFGAPVGLFCFIRRDMGSPQWSDLGMYLQSVMLLATEAGLATCAQECWSLFPRTVTDYVGAPPEQMLFAGMAIGYADMEAPENHLASERAPLDEIALFHGL